MDSNKLHELLGQIETKLKQEFKLNFLEIKPADDNSDNHINLDLNNFEVEKKLKANAQQVVEKTIQLLGADGLVYKLWDGSPVCSSVGVPIPNETTKNTYRFDKSESA